MPQVYKAVYEQRAFRPIAPPAAPFTEAQTVRIVVETTATDDLLSLAAQVYDGLTDEQVQDVEVAASHRSVFFAGEQTL